MQQRTNRAAAKRSKGPKEAQAKRCDVYCDAIFIGMKGKGGASAREGQGVAWPFKMTGWPQLVYNNCGGGKERRQGRSEPWGLLAGWLPGSSESKRARVCERDRQQQVGGHL